MSFGLIGDVRVRGESFFQDRTADRTGARIRVRLGFEGKLTEDHRRHIGCVRSLGDPRGEHDLHNQLRQETIGH